MPKNSTDTPPHPDYGLAQETRTAILRDAAQWGVRVAADKNGVSESVIYVWRKRLGPRSEKQ